MTPMRVAAKIARLSAREKTGLPDEDIGVLFITPCPGKVSAINEPVGFEETMHKRSYPDLGSLSDH